MLSKVILNLRKEIWDTCIKKSNLVFKIEQTENKITAYKKYYCNKNISKNIINQDKKILNLLKIENSMCLNKLKILMQIYESKL